jgi:hypothetical protein
MSSHRAPFGRDRHLSCRTPTSLHLPWWSVRPESEHPLAAATLIAGPVFAAQPGGEKISQCPSACRSRKVNEA